MRTLTVPEQLLQVVFFLLIQSSYAGDTEAVATEDTFDTVQFYCASGTCWRIKTYATDQDVHVWNLGAIEDIVALARANTEKHYGDVLTEGYILTSESGLDDIREQLKHKGLSPTLEVSSGAGRDLVPLQIASGGSMRPNNAFEPPGRPQLQRAAGARAESAPAARTSRRFAAAQRGR